MYCPNHSRPIKCTNNHSSSLLSVCVQQQFHFTNTPPPFAALFRRNFATNINLTIILHLNVPSLLTPHTWTLFSSSDISCPGCWPCQSIGSALPECWIVEYRGHLNFQLNHCACSHNKVTPENHFQIAQKLDCHNHKIIFTVDICDWHTTWPQWAPDLLI